MNLILESDFEKKMALVGLLKQYAEQRDVTTFANALIVILSFPQHQAIIKEIR